MAAISWISTSSGNWSTASNWSSGTVPGAGDDVTINTSSSLTITYSTGTSSIHSLYCNTGTLALSGGSLSVLGNATIYSAVSQTAGTLNLDGGHSSISGVVTQSSGATLNVGSGYLTLSGSGNSFAGTLTGASVNFSGGSDTLQSTAALTTKQVLLTGATLTLTKSLSFSGSWSETAGILALGSTTLTLAGPSSFDGGIVSGTGKIVTSGATEIGNGFALEGSSILQNSGTLEQVSNWYLGYNGTDTAQLINSSSGTFTLDNNSTIYATTGALLTNSGAMVKTGSGITSINASTTSTGSIAIKSGDLRFAGPTNSFGGTINGAGTAEFYAGTDALASGFALSTASVLLDGATVTLGGALAYAGTWNQTAGAIALADNTLTLTGAAYLDGGAATGSGTIAGSGSDEVSNYYLEGSVVLSDSGSMIQDGFLYVGYNGTDTARLNITVGGGYSIAANSTIYGTTGALLNNAGTLTKSSGSGTSVINVSANMQSGSTTTVASGVLRFSGATNVFAGTLNGAGTAEFNTGSDSFAGGLVLSVGSVALDGATITLGGSLTYAGNWNQSSGSLALGGKTLTLTGAASLDGGGTSGSGTLAVASGEIAAYLLEGSTVLSNTGAMYETGYMYVGYNSGDTAQFKNSGNLYIENNAEIYGTTGGLLNNTGTVTKLNGIGTTQINVSVAGKGKYVVDSGTLRFSGGSNVFSSTISGLGTAEFNAGAVAFNTGTKLTVSNVLLDGASVTLGTAITYASAWSQTAGTLALGGKTLTLSGVTNLDGGVISGSGTLAVKNAQISTAAIEGSVVLQNSGSIEVTSYMYLGYNSADTAALSNLAGATFRLDDNATIYSVTGASINNAGTFLKATGSGTSAISASITSSGTITAITGVLRFSGATNVFSGAISGTGTVEMNSGSDTLNTGTSITVSQLLLDGASVNLAVSLSDAGVWDLSAGTLALGGNTLTLSGSANFDGGAVTGSGTIAASGTTELNSVALEGSVVLNNTGTIEQTNYWYLGYNSADTAQLNNETGATLIIQAGTTIYASTGALLTNTGTLIKNGSAASRINASINDTGTTTINGGSLQFTGTSNNFGGVVQGAGTAEFLGGTDTVNSGTSLTVDSVLLDGATLSSTIAIAYSGAFSQTAGSIALGGKTLTLSGTVALDGGIITGAGTISVTGVGEISSYALEGTSILKNSGTLTQAGYYYIGYNSGDAAQLQNQAGATYRIVDNATIYGTTGSSITNAGNFIKALGSGTSTINVAMINTGTVQVAQGGLAFADAVSGSGSFTEGSATTLIFSAAVAAGGTVTMGADALLAVNAGAGFADTIKGFAFGNVIDTGVGYNTSETLSFNSSTNVLTLTNGSSSYNFQFSSGYTLSSFALFNDNGGAAIGHS